MAERATVRAEVCVALPRRVVRVPLMLQAGATVGDALQEAMQSLPPELRLDLAASGLGVFGQACWASRPLRDGDRVEVYRPLVADPNATRQRRAALRRAAKPLRR